MCGTTFADGTFFWCPKLFTQVFTVHTLHENVWILLPFLLLHNKSTESYRKLFFILKSEREKIILLNKPLASFVDLELSIFTMQYVNSCQKQKYSCLYYFFYKNFCFNIDFIIYYTQILYIRYKYNHCYYNYFKLK